MVKQIHVFFFLIFCPLLILSGCGTTDGPDVGVEELDPANTQDAVSIPMGLILQTQTALDNSEYELADTLLQQLQVMTLSNDEYSLRAFVEAQYAELTFTPMAALQILNQTALQDALLSSSEETQLTIGLYKANVLEASAYYFSASKLRVYLAPLINDQAQYLSNHYQIWQNLQRLTADDIRSQLNPADTSIFQQWLPLSLMMQHSDLALDQQIAALQAWQEKHPTHPAAMIPLPDMSAIRAVAEDRPKRIAVLLPFDGKYRKVGEAIRDGLLYAYYQTAYQPHISFYSVDNHSFMDTYQDAIADGAEMIIGPLFKNQLEELYQLPSLPVPTLALNKLDIEEKPENLIEFGMAQEDEISSLIKLAGQFDLQHAAIVRQNAGWSEKASQSFIEQWTANENTVINEVTFSTTKQQSQVIQAMLNIDKSNQRIRELRWLTGINIQSEPRRRQDIDMIVMLAKPEQATSIRPLLAFHYASDIPVFATSSVYRGYLNTKKDNDLNGVKITEVPLLVSQTEKISAQYKKSPMIRMYAFGMDAFQLAERYQLLQQLDEQKIYGATGELTLADNIIQRETAFAQFRRGRIKALAKLSQTLEEDQADN